MRVTRTFGATLAVLASILLTVTGQEDHRSLQTTEFYYKQGITSGDGTSPLTPFSGDISDAMDVLAPGDTLYLMGTITNPSYNASYVFTGNVDDPHLWHSENTLRIHNKMGAPNQYTTITSFPGDPAILMGDGANILRISNSAYLKIIGLEIIGEVDRIPYETAKALQFVYRNESDQIQYRVDPNLTEAEIEALDPLPLLGGNIPRPSYTDTRGLYMSNSVHVELRGNKIHHIPGNGLRVSYGEHVDIVENEVYATSRKSYSGTHGLVVTQTQDTLPREGNSDYRIRVLRNIVHDNYNEIFSWVGTKDFIVPRIDEGKGISLQRNEDFQNGGTILVADNIAYGNGFSGVHSNDGDNVHMIGNTAYLNSYTNSVTYQGDPRGNNIGISMSGGQNCIIANNVVVIDSSWNAFPISIVGGPGMSPTNNVINITVTNNLVYGTTYPSPWSEDADLVGIAQNTLYGDPLFRDADNADFFVLSGSPARTGADAFYSAITGTDAFGVTRSLTAPTLGAVESILPSSGGGGGDPHFKTWKGEKYDYHGECDLVLVHNPSFADGLGLDIHIRTSRKRYMSYIERVAIRIGSDIMEFANSVDWWLNGELMKSSGKLSEYEVRRWKKAISIRLDESIKSKIDLITRKNGMPYVHLDGGTSDIFLGSLGMIGDFETGHTTARDGKTILPDPVLLAREWQVRPIDGSLFMTSREPQYPKQCLEPKKFLNGRLGLSHMQKSAEQACKAWGQDIDECIFDVIATRDMAAAEDKFAKID